jgi:Raf kinase inhibitor-like YbhB/YbcL family protein
MDFNITSTAFEEGADIPVKHTCDGDNISPPLRWGEAPKDTASFALIMEDPDAPSGTFTHWIVYNLPPECNFLDKIVPIQKNLENGAIQGKNDFGKYGYKGPCPNDGKSHRYIFRIFALRKKLPPESANTGLDFYEALNGLAIDRAEYMGRYKRL